MEPYPLSMVKVDYMHKVEFFVGSNFKEPYTFQSSGINQGKTVILDKTWTKEHMERRIVTMLSRYGVDGFSANWIIGYWKGDKEDTLHITLYIDWDMEKCETVARRFAVEFQQESVLMEFGGLGYFIER